MKGDDLGNRMKDYENAFDHVLPPMQPVILRLDGNSFSLLTRQRFAVPFDDTFKDAMYQSAIAVLDYCHGKIAYVQSDEISVLIINEPGNAFLKNRVQKICSLVASACAVRFSNVVSVSIGTPVDAQFDCRCFVMPPGDIPNYFTWRQVDAMKNAINSIYYWKMRETMSARSATAAADGIATDRKVSILATDHGVDISSYPIHHLRGAVVYKKSTETPIEDVIPEDVIERYHKHGEIVTRKSWFVDKEIPVFSDTRSYLPSVSGNLSHF